MIRPTKTAYLKHDLYKLKIDRDELNTAFTINNQPKIDYIKVASKGMRFVYCQTDRRDAANGWYADDGSGYLRIGIAGFGKMTDCWAKENLTDPTDIYCAKFRNNHQCFPEIMSEPYDDDDDDDDDDGDIME